MAQTMEYAYVTLGALSPPADSDCEKAAATTESYAVLRSEITSTADDSAVVPVVDYFSLDVFSDAGASAESQIPIITPAATPPRVPETDFAAASELAWFRAGRRFKSPMLQLHKEIVDFCNFVSPTREEQASRASAVDRVFGVVKYIWPHCKVEVFGSFRTGLYLPTSDIDAVILEAKVNTPQMGLYALAKALSQRGIARKVQVIAKARVPIIKFVEKTSGVAFDISFDVDNGPKAADFIQAMVSKIPPLRPLCMVLKVFLQQRELNEVYMGGIGSYTLLTMLIAHLQMQWTGEDSHGGRSMEQNLGVLLVNFFDLYGRKLNNCDVGVSCKSLGTFFLKSDKGFLNLERPNLLSVEDPQQPDNDIGRNSFNYFKVKSAFSMAYSLLTDTKAILSLDPHKSILGTIIRPDPILLNRRGGQDGDLTFGNLLPGAGEHAAFQQLSNGDDVFCNWQLVDEEPLPRETLVTEYYGLSPLRKRKATKVKHKSSKSKKQFGSKSRNEENGSRSELEVK